MKMDIGTPVELLTHEHTDFGPVRQVYLTFLNESPHVVTALSGRFMLLDGEGAVLENLRVSFGPMQAPPGRPFVCHLTLEDSPAHESATMLVEDVVFDGEEPWSLHPLRLKEYVTPSLAQGPDRNALIAVAGHDAVCFPMRQDNTWLCVCGRYNRWRWSACRRCQRPRDSTLADFTPDKARAGHAALREKAQAAPPFLLVDGRAARQRTRTRLVVRPPAKSRLRRIVFIALGCVAAAAVLVGALTLARPAPEGETEPPAAQTAAPAYVRDFLESIP